MAKLNPLVRCAVFLLILSSFPVNVFAQQGSLVDDEWLSRHYVKQEVMIPMRDGVRLYTAVYAPSPSFKSHHAGQPSCGSAVRDSSSLSFCCGVAGYTGCRDSRSTSCGAVCACCCADSGSGCCVGSVIDCVDGSGMGGSPIMLVRTPYSVGPYGDSFGIRGDMLNYAAEGYIIVYQNVRGRYLSEGKFENVRPLSEFSIHLIDSDIDVDDATDCCDADRQDVRVDVDDATDCYDTVEWLLENTENNGRVGVKGVSYNGFYATMALLSRHPAIVAVSPQSPVTDWFKGDDIHHNGVLCLADACGFGSSMFRDREQVGTSAPGALVKPVGPLYEFYLDKPASYWTDFFSGRLRFWTSICENQVYNEFWSRRDPSVHLKGIKAAVLVTGGLYDAEDCYGVFRTYNSLKSLSPDSELYLALGPWSHGAWNDLKFNHLSDAWFGENSSAYYRDKIEFPFFKYYLSGDYDVKPSSISPNISSSHSTPDNMLLQNLDDEHSAHLEGQSVREFENPIPKVVVLPSSETMKDSMAGVCTDGLWWEYPSWPPPCGKMKLELNSSLVSPKTSFISDPDKPVPYMLTDVSRRDKSYMAADQSFASSRADVLTFVGSDIEEPLHIAGPAKVSLNLLVEVVDSLKNSSVDADIVAKLIDIRPDGYQMLVRGDVMPLRFRNGFDKPVPVENGSMVHIEFEMCDIDHIFMSGHRLAVQVQGSCFPLFAVNRQNYTPRPMESSVSDGQKLKISILDGSNIEIGVVKQSCQQSLPERP